MAEKEYISREAVLERIDDIWDCADMVFEPNDHCCRADDCASCKWAETKNAIRKIIANFPAADVRPVVRAKWIGQRADSEMCSACGVRFYISALFAVGGNNEPNFCPNCGADMREES